jgi:hypothetical protein
MAMLPEIVPDLKLLTVVAPATMPIPPAPAEIVR